MKNDIKNKRHLTSVVANKTGKSKKDVAEVLNALGEVVEETLKAGGEVVLPGHIKVLTKVRSEIPQRESKHPRTGEKMIIERTPARRVVKAQPLPSLRGKVEENV